MKNLMEKVRINPNRKKVNKYSLTKQTPGAISDQSHSNKRIDEAYVRSLEYQIETLEKNKKEMHNFNAILSHDLTAPLRTITSFAKLLQRRHKDELSKEATEYLDFIQEGTDRINLLVKELRSYTTLDKYASKVEMTRMNALVYNVIRFLRADIDEAKATIEIDQLPKIRTSGALISLVFQNLIQNALKFRGTEKLKISISAKDFNDAYLFCVKDNGIGIEAQQLDHIFDLFSKLNPEKEGSGMGLSICKKIIKMHNGSLWVESTPGEGSSFFFTIPKSKMS